MKMRTDLHAGASCAEANLWRKRAEALEDGIQKCKERAASLDDYPLYVWPGTVVTTLPANIGGYIGGAYNGQDYSGYCG